MGSFWLILLIIDRYFGHMDVSVPLSAFIVAMTLVLQRGNPRFAQLSSAMFGLFYCGYLPCFWVRLRCSLAAPALNTSKFSCIPHCYQCYKSIAGNLGNKDLPYCTGINWYQFSLMKYMGKNEPPVKTSSFFDHLSLLKWPDL